MDTLSVEAEVADSLLLLSPRKQLHPTSVNMTTSSSSSSSSSNDIWDATQHLFEGNKASDGIRAVYRYLTEKYNKKVTQSELICQLDIDELDLLENINSINEILHNNQSHYYVHSDDNIPVGYTLKSLTWRKMLPLLHKYMIVEQEADLLEYLALKPSMSYTADDIKEELELEDTTAAIHLINGTNHLLKKRHDIEFSIGNETVDGVVHYYINEVDTQSIIDTIEMIFAVRDNPNLYKTLLFLAQHYGTRYTAEEILKEAHVNEKARIRDFPAKANKIFIEENKGLRMDVQKVQPLNRNVYSLIKVDIIDDDDDSIIVVDKVSELPRSTRRVPVSKHSNSSSNGVEDNNATDSDTSVDELVAAPPPAKKIRTSGGSKKSSSKTAVVATSSIDPVIRYYNDIIAAAKTEIKNHMSFKEILSLGGREK